MNAVTEKKQANATTPKVPSNGLQNSIDQLDSEMKSMLKNAIDQLTPGKPFNPALLKELRKRELRKNRLITARLDALLQKGRPEAKEIVDRLLAIEV